MSHCGSVEQTVFTLWRPEDQYHRTPLRPDSSEIYRPDIFETIEAKIKELSEELRTVSLDIHGESDMWYGDSMS